MNYQVRSGVIRILLMLALSLPQFAMGEVLTLEPELMARTADRIVIGQVRSVTASIVPDQRQPRHLNIEYVFTLQVESIEKGEPAEIIVARGWQMFYRGPGFAGPTGVHTIDKLKPGGRAKVYLKGEMIILPNGLHVLSVEHD